MYEKLHQKQMKLPPLFVIYFPFDNDEDKAHTAEGDAMMVAKLYPKL